MSYLDTNIPNTSSSVSSESQSVLFSETVCIFLNCIEGWKTRIKNLHWSATKLNMHEKLDEIAEFVASYEDEIAEDFMASNGKFTPNMLKGEVCDAITVRDLMNCMITKTSEFYTSIPDDVTYVGIKSETETFIHNIQKYRTVTMYYCDDLIY